MLTLCVSVTLLLMVPLDAGAQVVATSFEELQALVKRGDTIDVTDASGRKLKGRVGQLSASSLELLVRKTGADGRDTFVPQAKLSEGDVRQILLQRGDSLWNGTLIGLAAVGVPWLLVCGANDWCVYNEYGAENLLRTAALISSGMSAGIGALIDASIKKRRTVYYRVPDQRSFNFNVAPLISKQAGGIQMSVRF